MIKNDNFVKNLVIRARKSHKIILDPFGMPFRWCNNNCSFCYLKNYMFKKPLPIDDMNKILNNMLEWLDMYIEEFDIDTEIRMILIGGELFCLGDEYYRFYKKVITLTDNVLKKHCRRLKTVGFCTNLLLNEDRRSALIDLHKHCISEEIHSDIFTSYDLYGRFDCKEKIELWYNNVEYLRKNVPELGIGVEFLLIKQGLERYVDNIDCPENYYFDKIMTMDIDILGAAVTQRDNPQLVPSQDTLYKFYEKILNLYGINNMLEEFETDLDRMKPRDDAPALLIYFDQDGVKEKYCDGLINRTIDNEVGEKNFRCMQDPKWYKNFLYNKIGCASCKYIKQCHINHTYTCNLCYMENNGIIGDHNCYLKRVYKLVEKYNELQRKNN